MKKPTYQDYIIKILRVLEKRNILSSLHKPEQFSDDPKFHRFSTLLHTPAKYSDGIFYEADTHGLSFRSKRYALFTCLTEALERFSQSCYRETDLIRSSYEALHTYALSPKEYIQTDSIEHKTIGWTKGYDLINNTSCLIPAQLVYLTYDFKTDGIMLTESNTNGTAGDFDQTAALLKAIYEAIERDGLMTIFFAQLPAPRISIEKIPNKEIQKMYQSAMQYNLELMLFDITTDIGIPSYMGILVDKTGLGPCLSIGAKTSLNQQEAVIGALKEAFLTRTWIRQEMIINPYERETIDPKKINTMRERGLYWSPPFMLTYMDFLLQQKPIQKPISNNQLSPEKALSNVITILKEKKIDTYYVDVSWKPFQKDLGYHVYKAIMPQLHSLFLFEKNKRIQHTRLQTVSEYFNKKTYTLPSVPLPYL